MNSKPWKITGEPGMCMVHWKKLVWKDHIPSDSIYMTTWKRQNYRNDKSIMASRDTSGEEG